MISFAEGPPSDDGANIVRYCNAAVDKYRNTHGLGLGDPLKVIMDIPAETIGVEGGGKPRVVYTFGELSG